ncbi:malonyl-ACP O-methyltransferase BioC [Ferviditalea candida]|uniref:Malonyl-[acyl-carrier protein] O-methyltransferase n=1 Tax=Ferviditalea candida TaxID=3108399 RepID=A0ABU5ZIA2_9BACL|nr:malonyl-ACP O-methyltransferase BioC [Paenibacillaceae bacterium T2]
MKEITTVQSSEEQLHQPFLEAKLNKELVRKHFDRHAREYDQYAEVQRDMGQKLLEAVDLQHGRRRFRKVLEIGCGTGHLTRIMSTQFPRPDAYTAIDLSPEMIEVAKSKLGERAREMTFIAGDAEALSAEIAAAHPGAYDLIISNATFQWFNNPIQTIRTYLKCLQPGGILAFATFGPDTFFELHDSFAFAESTLGLKPQYHGQPYPGSELWRQVDSDETVTIQQWDEEYLQVTYPNVRDFLYQIKRIGAGNAMDSREEPGIRTGKELFRRMEKRYAERHAASNGGIQATYHILTAIIAKTD